MFRERISLIHFNSWHHVLKGKFLEGKRNRRLDHLVHVLVNEVMPYYKGKHWRQYFGFEGPDLEISRRRQIGQSAIEIQPDHITEVDDEGQYTVQSQTTKGRSYSVNIEQYTCDCDSYPLVSYCKHLAAVQIHYTEGFDIQQIGLQFVSVANKYSSPSAGLSKAPTHAPDPNTTPDDLLLASVTEKLQRLTVRTRLSPPHHISESFRQLNDLLDRVLAECEQPQVLPKQKKVPPNQRSWPETAKVMGAAVKSKRKNAHPDPYSGGERSAKKAKPDARVGPVVGRGGIRCVCSIIAPSPVLTLTPSAVRNHLQNPTSHRLQTIPATVCMPSPSHQPPRLLITTSRHFSTVLSSNDIGLSPRFNTLNSLYTTTPSLHHTISCTILSLRNTPLHLVHSLPIRLIPPTYTPNPPPIISSIIPHLLRLIMTLYIHLLRDSLRPYFRPHTLTRIKTLRSSYHTCYHISHIHYLCLILIIFDPLHTLRWPTTTALHADARRRR